MLVKILRKHGHEMVELNRRRAIRERCMNCSGWNNASVRDCEFQDCNLFPYRSGQGKQDAKKRSLAIRRYCLWCCNGQLMEVSKCPSTDCPLFPYRKTITDKSVKVGASSSKSHIRPFQDNKNEKEYQSMG